MKGAILTLLFLLTAGAAYCAWRQGALADLLPAPRVEYVTREHAEPGAYAPFDERSPFMRQMRLEQAHHHEDWRTWRQYDASYQRGLVHTGIDDIDEAVVATYGLGMANPELTPSRWRARWDAGTAWLRARDKAERERDPGPDEECVDWQGRDAGVERRDARPVWVEPRRESQYRRAMRHLLFGPSDEERNSREQL